MREKKQEWKVPKTLRHQRRREMALKNLEARLADPAWGIYKVRPEDTKTLREKSEQERDTLRQRLGKGVSDV